MASSTSKSGFFGSFWLTLARIAFTAIFFFWLYWIGVSTNELNDKINAASSRFTVIDTLQVEYKNEVQEWKDLLLRSPNRKTLNMNWRIYDKQYRKVAAAAQKIVEQSDARPIDKKMQEFIKRHKENRDKYKDSVLILIKSRYFPSQADAAVKGIDRPLLDLLKSADVDMQDERKRTNDSLIAEARNRIEQSLFALGFIGLLAIWMPKH